jgi:type II secretory pathway component PulF
MHYHITGTNHDTGARMTLQVEAESKAAAEKKAQGAGMDVLHVQDIAGGDAQSGQERRTHRGEYPKASGSLLKLLILLALIAAAAFFAWPKIRSLLHSVR